MQETQDQSQNDEISIVDYWRVIMRRKKLIIGLFTVSVVLTLVISLLMPKYYKSEAVIMAASPEMGGLSAALSSIPLAGAVASSLTGLSTPADKMLVFLKSRTIAEMVIKRFDLMHIFYKRKWDPEKGAWKDPENPPRMEDAVKFLTKKVADFKKDKSGAVSIAVEWKDPKLAADMANYYVTALTEVLKDKSVNTTVQIVDHAVPAERKSWPRIKINMAVAGVLSLLIGMFLASFLENRSKRQL